MKEKSRKLFGEMLVEDNVISEHQLNEALEIQRKGSSDIPDSKKRIGVILCELGYLNRETLEEYINKVIVGFMEE